MKLTFILNKLSHSKINENSTWINNWLNCSPVLCSFDLEIWIASDEHVEMFTRGRRIKKKNADWRKAGSTRRSRRLKNRYKVVNRK